LKNEEKVSISSRIETEKQYFMRKIDANTFSKIMIAKQEKITSLRSLITENEKKRIEIIKLISIMPMIKWFGLGFKDLPINIKNLFIKGFSKIKIRNLNLRKPSELKVEKKEEIVQPPVQQQPIVKQKTEIKEVKILREAGKVLKISGENVVTRLKQFSKNINKWSSDMKNNIKKYSKIQIKKPKTENVLSKPEEISPPSKTIRTKTRKLRRRKSNPFRVRIKSVTK